VTAITAESSGAVRSDLRAQARAVSSHATLGFCWVVYGVLRIVMAVILAISSGTATVMFGALLVRVADPFSLMTLFHVTYLFIIILSGVGGVIGILAGLALMGGGGYGRTLALLAAILSVSEVPIGTTLGVFTLVALLPESARIKN
jgi:hypothetical protein